MMATSSIHDGPPAFLACGDLAVDSVVMIDHFPTADEKLWVEPAGDYPGGMMGNAAAAAASVGIHAGVVALVGSDDHGRLVMDALHRRGIDTRFVREVDAPTFWTLSLTLRSGARSLIQFPTSAFGSDWAHLESGTFRFRDPLNRERRFIPLRLDDAPIKGSLAQFLYIDWRLADRAQPYARLVEAGNHRRKSYQRRPLLLAQAR